MTTVVSLIYVAKNCRLKKLVESSILVMQKNENKHMNECSFILMLMQTLSVRLIE